MPTASSSCSNAIQERLAGLIPADVAAAAGAIEAWSDQLFPEEATEVDGAVESRRAAFRAGRAAARAALRALGRPPAPIPRAPERDPVWPAGLVGAITHSRTHSAALVAPADLYLGLGVDLEGAEPLKPQLRRKICRPEDRVDAPLQAIERGKLIFSAKEAVFKAYYPRVRRYLDFLDAVLEIDEASGAFRAEIVNPDSPPLAGLRAFEGRWCVVEGQVLTALCVPAGEGAGA
ncbi:MAG: 4'-phosphopantetheinyl transferase superfamily protein [Pseudomonadota bacterium]